MHHNDSPDLDPRTDITDLFVFQKPGEPSKSILILNVNPEATAHASVFDPLASYELKIDSNGDFEAETAYHIVFSPPEKGCQDATVYRAAGEAARGAGAVGEIIIQHAPVSFSKEPQITSEGAYRFFAGLRSEPFFADVEGFIHNFEWTGRDFWGDKNVFGIVLEVPNRDLGAQPNVAIWGRTLVPVHGNLAPVNQMGLPGTNVFRQGADTNATPPARQRESFLSMYTGMFRGFGYDEAEANSLALEWLPDILPYDYTSAAGFPNGRHLTDDVVDHVVEIMTHGKMKDDLLKPHTNYLAEFPYLGIPL